MIKTCCFASLFGHGFDVTGRAVIDDMVLHNEAHGYAARALLETLVFEHLEAELPAVTSDEVAAFCQRMAGELDYLPDQFAGFLAAVDLTPAEAYVAVERHLRLTRYLGGIVSELGDEPAYREALLRQAFLDLTLRPRALRVAGIERLAARAPDGEPGAERLAATRQHFAAVHDRADWSALQDELAAPLGDADQLDARVRSYARAAAAADPEGGSPCGGSRS